MRSLFCLFVCVPALNQLELFNKIQYEGRPIEGDLEATLFNPVASTN
jgi:hypothetical protein